MVSSLSLPNCSTATPEPKLIIGAYTAISTRANQASVEFAGVCHRVEMAMAITTRCDSLWSGEMMFAYPPIPSDAFPSRIIPSPAGPHQPEPQARVRVQVLDGSPRRAGQGLGRLLLSSDNSTNRWARARATRGVRKQRRSLRVDGLAISHGGRRGYFICCVELFCFFFSSMQKCFFAARFPVESDRL